MFDAPDEAAQPLAIRNLCPVDCERQLLEWREGEPCNGGRLALQEGPDDIDQVDVVVASAAMLADSVRRRTRYMGRVLSSPVGEEAANVCLIELVLSHVSSDAPIVGFTPTAFESLVCFKARIRALPKCTVNGGLCEVVVRRSSISD